MTNQKYIAKFGPKFTIEWYYNHQHKSPALEYFQHLNEIRQNKLFHLFAIISQTGEISNIQKFRHEGNKIYVFKASEDRFFCFFFQGSKIIVTNAYEKQSDKMPVKEYDKAIKARQDYELRIKQGIYYEKTK